MEQRRSTSHLSGGNAAYVEDLYEAYLKDPNEVPPEWRDYFDRLPKVDTKTSTLRDLPHSVLRAQFARISKMRVRTEATRSQDSQATEYERKQVRVVQMISAYRQRGHQKAKLDPLSLHPRAPVPDLDLEFHELSEADLDTVFQVGSLYIGKADASLAEIRVALEKTYCHTIGAEFMHIVSTDERHWIMSRIESVRGAPALDRESRVSILRRLIKAEGLEKSLASKYPGTKRFGLEGGESLIPMMSEAIQRCGGYGAKEVVIGMAHRGRLNVLVNILGKNPTELFDEFEGRASYFGSGDVKYHQGFSSNIMTPGGEVHLALAFNPSHLEIVSPVVEGSVRARQDRRADPVGDTVVPIVIHGDAAFAGQGVVMETFQMSQTRGYKTGGTLHIVINNQVGFTTSRQDDARSTEYCTDIAKMVQAPIFHVNGDDPEAVVFVTQLAVDYRNQFKKDVVIDLVCYRRRGHNEADEPSVTQPMMYEAIRQHPSTRDLYAQRLIREDVLTEQEDADLMARYRESLDRGEPLVTQLVMQPNTNLFVDWKPYLGHSWDMACDTSIEADRLRALADAMSRVPEGFVLQRQVKKLLEDRGKMAAGAIEINWGFAENIAYASLLADGYPVRMTGQDIGRGTFSHRHTVLHAQNKDQVHIPIQHLSSDQAELNIYDSLLSEEAVLAFEYGYATTSPRGLVIWEAQFGDFANGAQVVIDQFISSGEAKWLRMNALVLLLPHGYEGQGPEHSSARLERYLQLCAEDNMQVVNCTTPANYFHVLRRQLRRDFRKPLVVMTPKSLLRHKACVSELVDMGPGTSFHRILDERDTKVNHGNAKRVVMCSGKVYFDLSAKRDELGAWDTEIVRLEQLYPFPSKALEEVITMTPEATFVWCQEEPKNMGAWTMVRDFVEDMMADVGIKQQRLVYAGRAAAASPATGSLSRHNAEQQGLVAAALGLNAADKAAAAE
ncbi:MAG TPA: 2-oxoglutarate dehydrogenase E1 component [Halieaceae bacterium]|nr:2-oxoglutarate dehydrogenase E1 component [Halieaceae bacterium]